MTVQKRGRMLSYRAMYCYPWDLAEAGVRSVGDELRQRHINTITLAGSYHAGKFLRPHGRNGKVYFPADGTVYFKPDLKRYGLLKPQQSPMVSDHDIFADCCNLGDIGVNAWMVLLHNSRLGHLHPQSTVKNAFGDGYVNSLCPSAPEVVDYAVALCCDVTEQYPISGISFESPGFAPFFHGYHHEFGMVRPNVWLDNLLGLCFCEHCVAGSAEAGIDANALQARVKASVETYLSSDIDHPQDMASAFWQSELILDPDLGPFLKWRCTVVERLVTRIRGEVRKDAKLAAIPTVARPSTSCWYEGSDLAALKQITGELEVGFYEPGVDRIRSDLFDVARQCGGANGLRGILRPGYPDLESRDAVISAVAALNAGGVSDIAFYNYGHMRRASLDWVGDALELAGLTE